MHYKDGTEAKVGDLVKGTTYNTPKGSIHVGILLGITPGTDSCNARMLMPLAKQLPGELPPNVYAVQMSEGMLGVHREMDGTVKPGQMLVGHKIDYTACGDLELVHRPE